MHIKIKYEALPSNVIISVTQFPKTRQQVALMENMQMYANVCGRGHPVVQWDFKDLWMEGIEVEGEATDTSSEQPY